MSLDIRPNPSASGSTPTGGLTYKGSYDAALQSPNLDSSLKGDFYIVSDAGSLAGVALNIGDHIVFNQDASSPITSAMFDVIDNTDAVASVNTQTGVVVLDTDDISEGSNLYFTSGRAYVAADARIGAADLTDLNDVSYTAGPGIDNFVLTYDNASNSWGAEASGVAPVSSVNTQTGAVVLDSDDIAEGTTNLYYTNARFDTRFDTQLATKDTGDLSEGSNLYYTNARFDTQLATKDTDNLSEGTTNLYYTNARFDTQLATKDTGDLPEGSNLYYTNARSDARIGAADLTDLNDVNYTAGAGIDNYVLTYNHANTRWEAEVPATAPVSSVNTQTGAVVLDSDDIAEGTTNLYYTNARFDTRFDTQLATKDTGDLAEGSNLYYTNARFDTQLATKDSDDVGEGTTNLYYTNARADARIGAADLTDLNDVNYTAGAGIDNYVLTYNHANTRWEAEVPATAPVSSVNTQTGAVVLDSDDVAEGTTNLYYTNARFDTQLATKDTGDLSEGSNLYYTNTRVDARIAAANLTDLNDVNYTAGAGIDNYVLTYNHANTRWEAEAASGGGFSYTAITSASSPVTSAISTHYGADSSGGAIVFNLPALSGLTGGEEIRIKLNTAGNNLTLTANGSDTIEGVGNSTYVMSIAKESVTCVASSGTNWEII